VFQQVRVRDVYRYTKKYSIPYVLSLVKTSTFSQHQDEMDEAKKLSQKYNETLKDFTESVTIEVDGDKVKMASHRYQLFLRDFQRNGSIVCTNCKLKGAYFYKEKHILSNPYHFNLYGIDYEGNEIQFTKDHIKPKSKGGTNNLKNYQTMCYRCNLLKKDTFISEKGN